MQKRPSWDSYFMTLANTIATRGTCDRKRVGCVITSEKRVLSTGYNGSAPGDGHCDDIGHLMIDTHCERVVHAEVNAVTQAAKYGIRLLGATCYVTLLPCLHCYKVLANTGITMVVFDESYRPEKLRAYLQGLKREAVVPQLVQFVGDDEYGYPIRKIFSPT